MAPNTKKLKLFIFFIQKYKNDGDNRWLRAKDPIRNIDKSIYALMKSSAKLKCPPLFVLLFVR